MLANSPIQETNLVEAAVAQLNDALPSGWTAARSERSSGGPGVEPQSSDEIITLQAVNGTATFAVEARQSLVPRDVERLLSGLSRTFRSYSSVPILMVAPWLSTRTQKLLRQESINYIDLTGNAWISLTYPALFILTTGATRNPEPAAREVARLRGPKAGRLVRTLVDVVPPYGVRALAETAGLTPGYVSRLLDALDREALVERSKKGEIIGVDFPALLRRWVDTYDVLKSNHAMRFVAPDGPASALASLKDINAGGTVAVTGSFAAVRLAPVAAPSLLLTYVENVSAVVDALQLLPAPDGANVVLLQPFDPIVWEGNASDDGITYVAPSQAAADCLTGTGRMPSEGEALIHWMTEHEDRWRLSSLSGFAWSDRSG